ncbi:flagellar hook-length control protein FliK [Aeromonas salmonicida]|uniref:flagellar hook-length control protein FliK n=1 Tax=Aeromonas salmonicida TaxID=645 RepID=UPI00073B3B76|nr:flagellar hook-length control protein FliK [Aeromonas salmonicida]KTA81047.1 flagellar hook-length control protein FliK [Aeromonas salmonicida]MDE7528016.1 flagellar hook-length control protein FliK [Aeromonas salmonicida]MDE7532386.1 flagellar hook-length control protein FliK [Aeromonas salmonicida]UUI59655.1 flagellar hook-length control protein FliK [Aeromonas salmonicida]
MMQTLLTNTPSASVAPSADKNASLISSSDKGDQASQSDLKGGFSDEMVKAQQADKATGARQGSKVAAGEQVAPDPLAKETVVTDKGEGRKHGDAKSLADTTGETAATDDKEKKMDEAESSASPIDFLQRLQDALKQDTSLVSPTVLNLAPAVEGDGNMLPQEDEATASADALVLDGKQGDGKQAAPGEAALLAQQAASLLKGADAGAAAANDETPATEAVDGDTSAAMAVELKGDEKGKDTASADKGGKAALSDAERTALLSKVLPTEGVDRAPKGEGNNPVEADGSPKPAIPPMGHKEGAEKPSPLHTMNQAVPAQAGATRAFEEGLGRADSGTTTSTDAAQTQAVTEKGEQAKVAPAAKSDSQAVASSMATGAQTTPVAHAAEPVLTAPQQALASSESQGPQASLNALSAGLKQMEASDAPKAKADVKLDVKQKVAELGRNSALGTESTTQDNNHSQQVQQNSQPQAVNNDSKPTTDISARRDPQHLAHLKLASPEAPVQLHQKVNLMLTDKLQQAEIQLDPLGLGKMKIQIQMGADNQANVHFVVQHGQTREMLEQAMPRLRDMLAGQGIQLGQTLVQQQPQQQSQGQSAFSGQGQSGQNGSGSFSETGQTEAEVTAAGSRLSMESTNDAGIDFYA